MVSSTPRPHFIPGKDPGPILQEAGWAPGSIWMGGISRPHRDSIPERPARSLSLCRLSYPADTYIDLYIIQIQLRCIRIHLVVMMIFRYFSLMFPRVDADKAKRRFCTCCMVLEFQNRFRNGPRQITYYT